MGLPSGDTVFDYRDRAIIKFFLYSGARIGTACRLRVKDFHQDGDEATVTLHEKGDKHRRIGLHFAAAEAIAAYIAKAELTKGPLFRARLNSRSQKLGRSPIGAVTMYNLVQGYLARLPSSMREEEVTDEDGTVTKVKRCVYTPHSLRATTATLLARCRGGHHQGQGTARPPARDHHPDLRQATAEPQGRGLARRTDLRLPCPCADPELACRLLPRRTHSKMLCFGVRLLHEATTGDYADRRVRIRFQPGLVIKMRKSLPSRQLIPYLAPSRIVFYGPVRVFIRVSRNKSSAAARTQYAGGTA